MAKSAVSRSDRRIACARMKAGLRLLQKQLGDAKEAQAKWFKRRCTPELKFIAPDYCYSIQKT